MARQLSLRQTEGSRSNSDMQTETRIANGLGWFSIGLGVAEMLAPRQMAKLIGVPDGGRTNTVLRLYGMREIAAGLGILLQDDPAPWLWSRVGGDVLDLSSLGKAIASDDTERGKAAFAAAAVAGITALDVYCAKRFGAESQDSESSSSATSITSTVIIDKSPEEIYSFWRDFENFPRVSRQVESVEITGPSSSHWKVRSPIGNVAFEWDSEITEDRRNELISWRATHISVPHSGTVTLSRATGDRGTKVLLRMDFGGLGGKLGKLFSTVAREQANVTLHNLKQLLETGEVVQSDASIHAGKHSARPPENYEPRNEAMSALAGA